MTKKIVKIFNCMIILREKVQHYDHYIGASQTDCSDTIMLKE